MKVDIGPQTIVGYLTGIGTIITPAIAYANDHQMNPWVTFALLFVGGGVTAVTGKNRSDQAVAKTQSAAASSSTPAATAATGPMDTGDLDAVDLSDAELKAS